MGLVTRCPSCGTVFRVVRDQLKVSEGWVRCGRCTEVFNAGLRLFELESDGGPASVPAASLAPPVAPPTTAAPARGAPELAVVRMNPAPAPPGPVVEPIAESGVEASVEPAASAPAGTAATAALEAAPTRQQSPLLPVSEPTATAASDSATSEPSASLPADAAEPATTPGFVLRAERAARWRHPARRSLLAVLSLLLAALLGAQIVLHYRDGLAAGWPASRPWLQAACEMLGCRIEAPRRIESLSVDSSALVRIEGSPLYRLSLVVHNRSASAVHVPAIELALTDIRGQTSARRVLLGTELGHPSDDLPPRSEVPLQAMLELGEHSVAGYAIELFYP